VRASREAARAESHKGVAERLRPYTELSYLGRSDPEAHDASAASPLDDLMERVLTLVAIMPPGQRRATIAELVSPHEPERGSRAVDELIHDARLAEDDLGHLRLLRRAG